MLPGELLELQPGDEVLFCGLSSAKGRMEWILKNYNILLLHSDRGRPEF